MPYVICLVSTLLCDMQSYCQDSGSSVSVIPLMDIHHEDAGVFSCQAHTGRSSSSIIKHQLTVMNNTRFLTEPQSLEVCNTDYFFREWEGFKTGHQLRLSEGISPTFLKELIVIVQEAVWVILIFQFWTKTYINNNALGDERLQAGAGLWAWGGWEYRRDSWAAMEQRGWSPLIQVTKRDLWE